ncbi:hypothetical protein EAE91_23395 [Photorhabdus noenieputensis]|uniref:hypothetical protein n=1 Tax=Photorhabdus noenieputensis TaxID=1208607 RepID=UPI001BD43A01|nr:hypothetical protein [Photorhabdus noenieputensis]MBS9439980.1 hypothetical protein [Photorhabdus noenieputensis]MCK3668844.1 hypothetical protein [Photorhabdus noenieputensis]
MTNHHDKQRIIRAQARGVKAANIYRNLCQRLHTWDANCVTKARKYNLPSWMEHMPIYLLVSSIVVTLLIGVLMAIGVIILIFGLLLGLSLAKDSKQDTTYSESLKAKYRNGSEGYGFYSNGSKLDD